MVPFDQFNDIFLKYRTHQFNSSTVVTHDAVTARIKQLPQTIERVNLGYSFEGRSIQALCWGKGERTLLFWSQMHGDEATATKAIFDIINYLVDDQTDQDMKKTWHMNFNLVFVPMINPDGAERGQRENAQMIDINRDARRQTTPEAQILALLCTRFRPQWAFNLHDQSSYYAAGSTKKPATITLLAPPIDEQDTVFGCRLQAMLLIVQMNRWLQKVIPQGVAKWQDDFEPRAFGEWYQQNDVSTILIESGSFVNDPHREMARRLNFALLLTAIETILSREYETEHIGPYYAIPLNRSEGIFDRIERSISIEQNGVSFLTDRAYRNKETFIGDFSDYGALD